LNPLDARDDRLCTELGDNCTEMLEVIDLEVDGELGEIGRAARHADVVDIAVVLGDDGRDLGEAAGLVDVVDADARRETLRRGLVDVPAHVEPAFRLVLVILQRRRLDRIDRDPLARRDDADNAVARHRSAIGRELDRQVGIARRRPGSPEALRAG
jgi:hypothetical protein